MESWLVARCANCKEEVRSTALFCPSCGAERPMAAPPIGRPPLAEEQIERPVADTDWPQVAECHSVESQSSHAEMGYDTSSWTPDEFQAITDSLDVRGVGWHVEDEDTLVVAARHERLTDTVITAVTHLELALDDTASLSDEQFAALALDYTTDDWTPEAFTEITGSLATQGIRWLASDGYLLVPEEAEHEVDKIIRGVTGEWPR